MKKTARALLGSLGSLAILLFSPAVVMASEANLKIPTLSPNQNSLLYLGIVVCILGMLFGFYQFTKVKKLAAHQSMLDVANTIYETCKTYLFTQGKFLFILWIFIAVIILFYFGYLLNFTADKLFIILFFSIIGILGSYSVAWFGMRLNTYANSRTAFSVLKGYPYPAMDIPLSSGISIGTVLISIELIIMLFILLFIPGEYSGPCFIGFAIGESLGAAAPAHRHRRGIGRQRSHRARRARPDRRHGPRDAHAATRPMTPKQANAPIWWIAAVAALAATCYLVNLAM